MKLTTRQVAEKLGTSKSFVLGLRKAGKLKDLVSNGDGKKYHHALFDSKEVNQFALNFKKRISIPRNNEVATQQPLGLITRMERIENKLDQLIKMWS